MDARSYQTSVFRAQPSEGLQRKIQKRNRPPVSCLLCRTRKVKCDRQQPCERCVKSGEAAFCEYAPRAARKPRAETTARPQQDVRPKSDSSMSRPVLQVRLQKLEEMVSGLVHAAQSQGRDVRNTLGTPSSSDQRNETETRSDLSTPPSSIGTTGAPAISQAESGYVGATHWASILESIHDIRGIIETEAEEQPSSPASSPRGLYSDEVTDIMFGTLPLITLEQAVSRLPPRRRTDQLVLLYFRSRFSAAPYIHTSKFQREYDGFWRDPSSVSLLWMSILASMLWVATHISVMKGEDISKEPETCQPDSLAALAAQCLVAGDYLSGKPYAIEALLLLSYSELQRARGCDTSLWAKFGLLVRLAQRNGYHRDPKFLPNISPFEAELRRRAWFFIEVFDCIFSFQLGMPPIVRDDECDTESPGNFFDLDFDENTMVLPPPRPPTEPTSVLYLSYKSRLCRLLRRVIRYAIGIQQPTYEEVMMLNDELHQYHDSVPTTLRIRPVRSYSFTDQPFDIIHRLTIETMYLKSLCVLHRKYLNSEKNDPRYDVSRRICVDAAVRMLEMHAEYWEESSPGGRLYEDKHMLVTIGLHDYLISAMVLCLDLTENTKCGSQEARTRKLKALGASYKIWSDRKNDAKGAEHATKVVGAILRRVSIQEAPANPPPPPQPEVRDGSLARLLNNDTQPPPIAIVPVVETPYTHAMDFPFDFTDSEPLDSVLNDPGHYDWNMIDQFLLDR